MPTPRHFDGSLVRKLRRDKELTQKQVGAAEGVEVSGTAVANWEGGKSTPDPEKLPGLARVLGKPLDDLFPRDGLPDLADLRCDAGIPQYRTGKLIGTRSHIPVSNAERGVRPLDDDYVGKLAAAYKVTTEELRAAQDRSFGKYVPDVTGAFTPAAAPARPRTIAEKISYILNETYDQPPTDRELAARGNAKSSRQVLNTELVFALRTGAETTASDEVLNAMATALDVPPMFFRSDDEEVARIVASIRTAKNGLKVMAARGGENGGVSAELLDYVNDELAKLLGPDGLDGLDDI